MVEREQSFFSPGRVRQILRAWDDYLALEESPGSARGLRFRGPTPEEPKVGAKMKGHHGDPYSGVPIIADIVRAWKALDERSDEYAVVAWLMFRFTDDAIALGMKKSGREVEEILGRASEKMAAFLGWVPAELHPFSEEPKVTRACRECGGRIDDLRADAVFCGAACRLKGWRGKAVGATATG